MALVNALQNNSPEMFHQPVSEQASRFMKIRSIWPFPVRASQEDEQPDSESLQAEAGESVTPSSFVT
jgi:hypothetical protein